MLECFYLVYVLSQTCSMLRYYQMCSSGQTASQTTQTIQKHCVLVVTSQPYLLPTVISRFTQHNENEEPVIQPWIIDPETIAKAFGEVCWCYLHLLFFLNFSNHILWHCNIMILEFMKYLKFTLCFYNLSYLLNSCQLRCRW